MKVKLDIDSLVFPNLQVKLDRAGYSVVSVRARRSRSGKGLHVILELDPDPTHPYEVIALQAILGSDAYREASNLRRVRSIDSMDPFWKERWNVLYRPARTDSRPQ